MLDLALSGPGEHILSTWQRNIEEHRRYRTFCKIGWYDFRILHSKIWTELKLSQRLQEQQGPDLGTKIAIIFSKN